MAENSIKPAHNFIDRTGQKFNRLTVIERAPNYVSPNGRKMAQWKCICDCGTTTIVQSSKLRSGHTKSCGCHKREILRESNTTHGACGTPEHGVWRAMKARCFHKNHKDFHHYGGRGITVCPEWRNDFQAFIDHVGFKPSPDMTIDRINVDGNYEPGNVRWISQAEQTRNTRRNRNLTHAGKTMCLTRWADEVGLSRWTIKNRIDTLGWSVAEALTTPVGGRRGN